MLSVVSIVGRLVVLIGWLLNMNVCCVLSVMLCLCYVLFVFVNSCIGIVLSILLLIMMLLNCLGSVLS